MGKERQETQATQTVTPQPTAEETELNKLLLERTRATQPGMIQAQQQGLSLINQLLLGQDLPGYLGDLPGGISGETIGSEAARLAGRYGPGFQNLGILDSGVAYRETARGIANELLFPAEQYNLGNLLQLLNIGVGGQAAVQSPILQQGATLSQALAGLRPVTTTGAQSQVGTTNFFASAFGQGIGSGIGQGIGAGATALLFGT